MIRVTGLRRWSNRSLRHSVFLLVFKNTVECYFLILFFFCLSCHSFDLFYFFLELIFNFYFDLFTLLNFPTRQSTVEERGEGVEFCRCISRCWKFATHKSFTYWLNKTFDWESSYSNDLFKAKTISCSALYLDKSAHTDLVFLLRWITSVLPLCWHLAPATIR